jgi:hypothetical protein
LIKSEFIGVSTLLARYKNSIKIQICFEKEVKRMSQKMMVVAAHMGDFIWQCGGAIAKYADCGHEIQIGRASCRERV